MVLLSSAPALSTNALQKAQSYSSNVRDTMNVTGTAEIKSETPLGRSPSSQILSPLPNDQHVQEQRGEESTEERCVSEKDMDSLGTLELLRQVAGKDIVVNNEVPAKDLDNEMNSLMLEYPTNEEELFAKVPQVTSSLLEKVKGHPVREGQAFFLRTEHNPLSSQPNLNGVNGVRVDMNMYRVFEVDLAKYESATKRNQQKKAFQQLKMVFCDKTESRVKHLVGTFAHACNEPFLMPASFSANLAPSYRPGTVFLETEADASHPQIQLFFKLMGCHVVRVLPVPMRKLLEDNLSAMIHASTQQGIAQQMPHLHDYWEGIFCGHCQKTGPALRCPCKQAYYCNPVCQEAHWCEHKAKHRAELAAELRKKKAKAKGCRRSTSS